MSSLATVAIHASQFPEKVRQDLQESLRRRQMNHKFHYDSVKQTQKWLELHQAYSPSRTDPDCAATYDRSFAAAVARMKAAPVNLIGLGCGGGQKDARLLRLLGEAGKQASYTPSDVSTAMVLVARGAALKVAGNSVCVPLVCDLATTDDLPSAFETTLGATRLITFFGMIPNFEPQVVLPRLAGLLRTEDALLLSANLARGADYAAGVQRILPLYDNPLTRQWLMMILLDLGIEAGDGQVRFAIETGENNLKRVVACFQFSANRQIQVDAEQFEFHAGESIRLFFSYRYTPALVRATLAGHGLQVMDEWITQSQEEGVFLCCRR